MCKNFLVEFDLNYDVQIIHNAIVHALIYYHFIGSIKLHTWKTVTNPSEDLTKDIVHSESVISFYQRMI